VEKKLFACGEDKLRGAIDASQYLVLKFH
jgi:hypothetical protein